MRESEKWKWSRSVVSDPQRPHGLQPTRLLRPWDFPGKSTGVGCHCLLHVYIDVCIYVLCDTLLIVENYSELLPFDSPCGNRKVKTDDVSATLHREFLLILTTTLWYAAKDPPAKMQGNQVGLASKPQFSGLHWDRWVDVPVFQMLWTGTGAAGPPGARVMLLIGDRELANATTLPLSKEENAVRGRGGKRSTARSP